MTDDIGHGEHSLFELFDRWCGMDNVRTAQHILKDTTLTPEQRLERISTLDLTPEEARTVGRALYASMLANADDLCGDVPTVTGVHVRCGLETLLRAVADMNRQNHIRWRLESIMDANILNKPEPCWTLRVIAWGKDRQTAETLGDTLLMACILNQPDINPDQPFDRWHVPITGKEDGE